jgi:pimeloyl-ACP methyl ester carboxylesterase
MDSLFARLSLPVLAVCGDRDKKGVEQARLLFSRLNAGRLATLSDCGFLPMLEYPDQFARLVERFVSGNQIEYGERRGNDYLDRR